MPEDIERYLHFTVALLKDSDALEALWQDALKYHMIDQPGKLIAMRLTEYYEMKASGMLSPTAGVLTTAQPEYNGTTREPGTIAHTPIIDDALETDGNRLDDYDNEQVNNYIGSETPLATSPDVAHNAEAAAEYWTLL